MPPPRAWPHCSALLGGCPPSDSSLLRPGAPGYPADAEGAVCDATGACEPMNAQAARAARPHVLTSHYSCGGDLPLRAPYEHFKQCAHKLRLSPERTAARQTLVPVWRDAHSAFYLQHSSWVVAAARGGEWRVSSGYRTVGTTTREAEASPEDAGPRDATRRLQGRASLCSPRTRTSSTSRRSLTSSAGA